MTVAVTAESFSVWKMGDESAPSKTEVPGRLHPPGARLKQMKVEREKFFLS